MKKIFALALIAIITLVSGCSSATEPGTSVSGSITLSPDVAQKVTGKETLYIVARGPLQGGMPLAVQVIKAPKFPLRYDITKEDAISANTKFIGGITITVRLDKDGKIGDMEKGDFVGKAAKFPVVAGTKGVDVVIDTLGEDAANAQ